MTNFFGRSATGNFRVVKLNLPRSAIILSLLSNWAFSSMSSRTVFSGAVLAKSSTCWGLTEVYFWHALATGLKRVSATYSNLFLSEFGQVVLKLRATIGLDNFLPLWRVFKITKVWLDFARQNFQSGSLANSILANKSQDLAEARDWLS